MNTGWNENTKMTNHREAMAYANSLSLESALWTAQDCRSAIEANPDNIKNGYYADLALYCLSRVNKIVNLY